MRYGSSVTLETRAAQKLNESSPVVEFLRANCETEFWFRQESEFESLR